MTIREISPEDNIAVAQLIRSVFDELDIPKTGTAYEDPSLGHMYETYRQARSKYFVVEDNNTVIGGAGVGPLANAADTTCELQKMYFLPAARGKGIGAAMMQKCMEAATAFGYTNCYLETLPSMQNAQKLYTKFNFTYLDAPMGCTGHTSCGVWMIKNL